MADEIGFILRDLRRLFAGLTVVLPATLKLCAKLVIYI